MMIKILLIVFICHMIIIEEISYIHGFNLIQKPTTTSSKTTTTKISQPVTILNAQSNIGWHSHHHHQHSHNNGRISDCPYLRAMGLSSSSSSLVESLSSFVQSSTSLSRSSIQSSAFQQRQHQQLRSTGTTGSSTSVHMSDRVIDNYSNYGSKSESSSSESSMLMSIPSQIQSNTIQNGIINTNNLLEFDKWIWYMLDDAYTQSLQMKCPFFRRRTADMLDTIDTICRNIVVRFRHDSQSITLPLPASWRPLQQYQKYQYQVQQQHSLQIDNTVVENDLHYGKTINLSISEIAQIIQNDWHSTTNNKGYYITGRLTKSIFRDDCYFDGPDADMPIRGLRKYINAASQLFEYKSSTASLVSIEVLSKTQETNDIDYDCSSNMIKVKWIMSGVLRLPWKPKLPEVTGETTYYMDKSNLIYKHIETWDRTALQAFLETFWPQLATVMYKNDINNNEEATTTATSAT